MLNLSSVATALSGLVGWRQSPQGEPQLPVALTGSKSGLYVQDFSELLGYDTLEHVVPKGLTYDVWIARLQQNALLQFVPRLAAAQLLDGKVLLSDGADATGAPQGLRMVKNPARRTDTINKLNRFVGVRLRFERLPGVAYALPYVSLQLDGVLSEPVPIYLYSDQQPEPLSTVVISSNTANFPFAFTIPEAAALPANATYYLGYYEADLPLGVHALRGQIGPCGCADDPYTKWSQYVSVASVAIDPLYLDAGRLLFDADNPGYDTSNYGLNLFFLGYCDVATALKSPDNLQRLAPAVQLALVIRVLEAIGSSPNITQVAQRPDLQADVLALLFRTQAQLYGGKVAGTDEVYPSLLKSLSLDLSGLDAVCQQQPRFGLRMGQLSTR